VRLYQETATATLGDSGCDCEELWLSIYHQHSVALRIVIPLGPDQKCGHKATLLRTCTPLRHWVSTVKSHAPKSVGNTTAVSPSLSLWEMVTKQNNAWTDKWRPYSRGCCWSHGQVQMPASKEKPTGKGSILMAAIRASTGAVKDEVTREHDGIGSKWEPLFLKGSLRFGAFSQMGCNSIHRPGSTDKSAEAWPSWLESQKHALLSLSLGSVLALDIMVPQKRPALLS